MAARNQAILMTQSTAASYSAVVNTATYDSPGSSPTKVEFRSDGTVWAYQEGSWSYQYTWLTGTGTGADYEIRETLDGGSPQSFTSGTEATWEALSTTRTWQRSSASWIERTAIGLFEIRDVSTHTVLDNGTITLTSTYGTGDPP